MLQAERLDKIRHYMQVNKYTSIIELAEAFQTSTATIRRCLKILEQQNIIEIVRGGAVYINESKVSEQPYIVKKEKNEQEKSRIALYAMEFIQPNSSVYLDASTTVREMTVHINLLKRITVCTNDVMIAGELSRNEDITVMVTGGLLRPGYYSLSGYFADKMIEGLQVDYAFMGADAIDTQKGFMITNADELSLKSTIVNHVAEKTIVLCDHEKFDKNALLSIWTFSQINTMITGKELSDTQFEKYAELGLNVIRV